MAFYTLYFEHLGNKGIERIDIGRTDDMILFEHIKPRLSRFNGHTPQVIYGRLNTIVTPFVGASVCDPRQDGFPMLPIGQHRYNGLFQQVPYSWL